MKKDKVIFWVSTSLVSLMMLFSAYNYFTNEAVKNGFTHLGFPAYFRIELGIAKIIGALVLLVPTLPRLVKEAAYAGFAIVFISASIAHLAAGDPASAVVMPLVFLVVLVVSAVYYFKVNRPALA